MDAFFQQVSSYIEEHELLQEKGLVIAGVSGGADSLAMLIVLERLRTKYQMDLSVAHLNHCLRGEAADGDEAFVRQWCQKLNVPFFSRSVDVEKFAAKRGLGLEEAGRQARSDYFSELAAKCGGTKSTRIALAHHMDDQAETVLLHLGRGSGLDGLVGIKPQNGLLIRPLLGQSRRSIENFLTGQGITWRQDESNAEPFALRNRIRNQVIPIWQQALGYDPVPLVHRTTCSLVEDQKLLDNLAAQAAVSCRSGNGLDRAALLKLDPALQSRVLRLYWLEQTGSGNDLAYAHVSILRSWLMTAVNGQQISLPGHWQAHLANLRLLFTKATVNKREPAEQNKHFAQAVFAIPLVIPGTTMIPSLNLKIAAFLIENESKIVYNNTAEYFRLDKIRGCVVRQRLPGDRIHPFGRLGGKSLKKYFNEQKIETGQRGQKLLIALDNEIVWLPGYAAGADFVGRAGDGQSGPLVKLEILE